MEVIGVRFKSTKKVYYFSPNGFDIKKGDNVIVDTSRGMEFGQTVIGIRDVDEHEIVQPLQKVIRIATPEDEKTVETNILRQQEAVVKCQEKIELHKLDMKLVDAEYTFDGTKLIFYFTSDGRVDFRDLVKDLAVLFKTRIELRQIAVRDETKMLGGLGACGNEICCKRFLGDFATVSIKMAKEQNLSLNPTKISGLCGRLICCLNFEKDFYYEMSQKLPQVDEVVMSPKGQAEVVATFPLKESVKVKYTNPDGSTDTAVFEIGDITRIPQENRKHNHENNNENAASDEVKASGENDNGAKEQKRPRNESERKPHHHERHERNGENGNEQASEQKEQQPRFKKPRPEQNSEQQGENNRPNDEHRRHHQKNRPQNNGENAPKNDEQNNPNGEQRERGPRPHHNHPHHEGKPENQQNNEQQPRPEGERAPNEHKRNHHRHHHNKNREGSPAPAPNTKPNE